MMNPEPSWAGSRVWSWTASFLPNGILANRKRLQFGRKFLFFCRSWGDRTPQQPAFCRYQCRRLIGRPSVPLSWSLVMDGKRLRIFPSCNIWLTFNVNIDSIVVARKLKLNATVDWSPERKQEIIHWAVRGSHMNFTTEPLNPLLPWTKKLLTCCFDLYKEHKGEETDFICWRIVRREPDRTIRPCCLRFCYHRRRAYMSSGMVHFTKFPCVEVGAKHNRSLWLPCQLYLTDWHGTSRKADREFSLGNCSVSPSSW